MGNEESKVCPFCTQQDIKERRIIENDFAYIFPTNIPIVPGHVLIAPKRCVAKFEDLEMEEQNSIFELLRHITQALKKTFKAEGFNFAWNEGGVAGQSVPHFHLHVLPRKEGDEGIVKYEPRKFLYRPGSRENSPQKELLVIAEMIKKNL